MMNVINAINALSGHVWAFLVFTLVCVIFACKYKSGSGAIGFFVETMNAVHDNILAVVVISIGAVVSRYDRSTGTTLITIGATVWNNKPKTNGNGAVATFPNAPGPDGPKV
jgi:hypothetical protein